MTISVAHDMVMIGEICDRVDAMEEITHIDPDVAEFRHEMGAALEGSLAAMVDRTCYLTFVVERAGRDAVPDTVEQLTASWANALRLTPEA